MREKRVFLLNQKRDVDDYVHTILHDNIQNRFNHILIALTPSIGAYLKHKGLTYESTLPYFKNDSHQRLLLKSEKILTWMRSNGEWFEVGGGLSTVHRENFIYLFRFTLHYCLWATELVSAIIERHAPSSIGVAERQRVFVSAFDVRPEEYYLAQLVKGVADSKGISIVNIAKTDEGGDSKQHFLKRDQIRELGKFVVKYFLFFAKKTAIYWKRRWEKKPFSAYTTRFYSMASLVRDLEKKTGHPFEFIFPAITVCRNIPPFLLKILAPKHFSAIKKQREVLNHLVETIRNAKNIFSYYGSSFSEALARKTQDNLVGYMTSLGLWSLHLKDIFEWYHPERIFSNGNRADDLIIAHLATQRGIPSILVSHGSHVKPNDPYSKIEWGEHGHALLRGPFSHVALQSPLAEGYLESFPVQSKIVKTGPLLWGKPKESNQNKNRVFLDGLFQDKATFWKTKVILHAGTPKAANRLRSYVYEMPDEYVQSIIDLAETVENTPNVVLIVKFRESPEISIEALRALVPFSDKVILDTEHSMVEVFGITHLLVSFSSTTIEEAIQNRIPVLLYGGEGRYQHVASADSVVYHAKSKAELSERLNIFSQAPYSQNKSIFDPYIYSKRVRENPFFQ